MPRTKRAPVVDVASLLLEVTAAIGAGRITAARLDVEDEPGCVLYGVCEGGEIVIDEAVHIVETLLHEALHRLRPRWSEKRVQDMERLLFSSLTREQIEVLYTIYLTVRKRKTGKTVV